MRVATYTDPAAPSRGSFYALAILLLTLALGTGVAPTLAIFAGGVLPELITPLWLVLYLGAFLGLLVSHGINWISWLVRYRILLVLLLIGSMVSVSWSIDAQVSAERVVHLVGSSLIAIYIGFAIPLLTTLRIFAAMLALVILASVAVALGFPALGIENYEGLTVWRGVFNSKNDLGFWAGVGVLLYITLSESSHALGRKLLCFAMAGVCLGVLVMSQSATSLVAMLVAGALSLYLYIASRFQLGFIRMAFVAVLLAALTAIAIANIETTELVGRSGDLTGRSEVWRQVIKLIYEYPLTGMGYGALWFPTDATLWIQQGLFDFTWTVFHAHNGLLHIASEMGVPLALIAILMVAQQLIEIFYCQYERQQVGVLFVLGFAVAFLISNVSEARFMVTRELFWIFFVALPISMLRQINIVSDDLLVTPDDDQSGTVAHPNNASSDVVPGKPWLGPSARQITAGQAIGVAGVSTIGPLEADAGELADSVDEIDLGSVLLSLTETDIDLGDLLLDESDEFDVLGSMNTSKTVEADIDHGQSQGAPASKAATARVPNTHDHDDSLEVDRYDIDFDVDESFIDIDLDDDE